VLPGETVFENLEKFARYKAVLLTTDGDGNLVITRASQERIDTPVEHGRNILSANGTFSFKQRASVYTVTSHSIFQGNDQALVATIADAGVLRHRPITVIAEDQIAPVDWKNRAQWEASVRAARGTQLEVTVQGWRHDSGLWVPNRIVTLRAPWLGFEREDLLISGVTWALDEGGARAVLTLTRPEAYSLIPVRLKGLFESAS
jgi:prophage tail gpP-like protein